MRHLRTAATSRRPCAQRVVSGFLLGLVALLCPGPSAAAPGDVHTTRDYPRISVGIRVNGPWGGTFVSTKTVVGPTGDPQWAYCAQAPTPGGIQGGTETDLATLADYNAVAVRDNAHRIHAVLAASRVPSPLVMQTIQFRPAGGYVFDYDGVEVAAPDIDATRLLWNWFYPSGVDCLPFSAVHRIDVAAVQAAIWHYTDGFDPSGPTGFTKQAGVLTGFPPDSSAVTTSQIYDRYLELVALGDAATVPTATLEIRPPRNESGFLVFEIVSTGLDAADLDAGGALLYVYDPGTGTCDVTMPVTTVDLTSGAAAVCTPIVSGTPVTLSAAGTGTVPTIAYLDNGSSQDSVTVGTTPASADAAASTLVSCPHCPGRLIVRKKGLDVVKLSGEFAAPASAATPALVRLRIEDAASNVLLDDAVALTCKSAVSCVARSNAAKTAGGLSKVRLRMQSNGLWRIRARGFSDLSALSSDVITVQLDVDGSTYGSTNTWSPRANGLAIKRIGF